MVMSAWQACQWLVCWQPLLPSLLLLLLRWPLPLLLLLQWLQSLLLWLLLLFGCLPLLRWV